MKRLRALSVILTIFFVGCERPSPANTDDAGSAPRSCGSCGNGIVNCGETCDDGNAQTERCEQNAREKVCGADCRWTFCHTPTCGDGTINQPEEQCDDGKATRTCSNSCEITECGKLDDLDEFLDDYDCDGLVDDEDNCKKVYNPDQTDTDANGRGDACPSPPGECTGGLCGTPSQSGGCGCGGGSMDFPHPADPRPELPIEDDPDRDGWENEFDNCPFDANYDQLDSDADGDGDACDPDDCPSDCSK